MHVVVAPDKFKGTLTARQVADRVAAGIAAALDEMGAPGVAVVRVPVADGGDGTVDAALAAGYERIPVRAEGPTGAPEKFMRTAIGLPSSSQRRNDTRFWFDEPPSMNSKPEASWSRCQSAGLSA